MTTRVERLKKLLTLQEQLKAMHELRHAGFVAEAVAAKNEAAELVDRFNSEESMSALFPEVYHRRIGSALSREDATRSSPPAKRQRSRPRRLAPTWSSAAIARSRAADERERGDKERLEIIGQRLKPGK